MTGRGAQKEGGIDATWAATASKGDMHFEKGAKGGGESAKYQTDCGSSLHD